MAAFSSAFRFGFDRLTGKGGPLLNRKAFPSFLKRRENILLSAKNTS